MRIVEGENDMKMHPTITLLGLQGAVLRSRRTLDNPGFCILCGQEASGVEPDARKYECESCGKRGVYGAEELLLTGGPS